MNFLTCFGIRCAPKRFTNIRKLGSGGFSKISIVRDNITGDKVIMKRAIVYDDESEKNFKCEYSIMQSLSHKNIIAPLEFGFYNDTPYINLPMFKQDMFIRLLGKPLTQIQQKTFTRAMVGALSHAHARNIVHRDIKPENIFINDSFVDAVLADWGVAVDLNTCIPTGSTGTLSYAAPEVCREFSAIDWKKADVFSLGVTLYAIFSVDDLLERTNSLAYTPSQESIDKKINKMVCGPQLKNLLKKMVRVIPEERITMAEAMNHPYVNISSVF
ncbi:serine/threonine-protein kinase [Paramecium bursaria Chlorella virus CVB-1]|nr:serine/threonine-protein kinase [Paramecium bursaria Chlorella virus CVB-1]